ncbi:MAG: hypothetical protein K2W82_09855 [Candidatus Obscuribacterales bacterium]|nr:hypothetical protein [Candidatus Obscuribacterales bacterium]
MNSDEINTPETYPEAISFLTIQTERAIAISQSIAGHDAGERRFWASLLFTRLCTICVSILFLCPKSKINPIGIHWDFSAIASLVRNAYELSLTLYYLCFEKVSDDEWIARLRVIQLHDCLSRQRMFRDFDPHDKQLAEFEKQANELRDELQKNPFFSGLPDKQQKRFLKGESALMLIQDEILQRMGTKDISFIRGYYRFLSAQTHSLPLSFYRMVERGDGRGEETKAETAYISASAKFCAEVLSGVSNEIELAFASLVSLEKLKPYDIGYLLRKATIKAKKQRTTQLIIMPGSSPSLSEVCTTCGSELE